MLRGKLLLIALALSYYIHMGCTILNFWDVSFFPLTGMEKPDRPFHNFCRIRRSVRFMLFRNVLQRILELLSCKRVGRERDIPLVTGADVRNILLGNSKPFVEK